MGPGNHLGMWEMPSLSHPRLNLWECNIIQKKSWISRDCETSILLHACWMNHSNDKQCAEISLSGNSQKDWQEKGKNGTECHWSQHRLVHFVPSPCIREACAYLENRTCIYHLSPHFTSHSRLHLPIGGTLVVRLQIQQLRDSVCRRKHSPVGSTPATPTDFLEPLWDSEANTAAHSVIFYPNWLKLHPMLWSTGKDFFLVALSAILMSAVVTDADRKVGICALLSLRPKINCTVPKDAECCSMSRLMIWKSDWAGWIRKWHDVIWQSKQKPEIRLWKTAYRSNRRWLSGQHKKRGKLHAINYSLGKNIWVLMWSAK